MIGNDLKQDRWSSSQKVIIILSDELFEGNSILPRVALESRKLFPVEFDL